jgi:hypothetical protein
MIGDSILNGRYSSTSIVGKNYPVFLLVLIIGFLFLIIFGALTKKYSVLGEMIIDESSISISAGDCQKVYNITDIKGCTFKLKGYDGESPIMRSAASYAGNFNYITINLVDEIINYEFYIADSMRIKSLLSFIELWRQSGCSVEFKYGDKSY